MWPSMYEEMDPSLVSVMAGVNDSSNEVLEYPLITYDQSTNDMICDCHNTP